jgi:hypothetical protein
MTGGDDAFGAGDGRDPGKEAAVRAMLVIATAALIAPVALAETAFESWEGSHTVLGMYGTGSPPILAQAIDDTVCVPVHGEQVLRLIDNSPTGTPQAYVAWIRNLAQDDTVTVTLHRYDVTPDGAPSCRLWAHWNDDPSDIDGFYMSAGGNEDYGPGTGWDEVSWSWVVPPSNYNLGLVIEVRTYSSIDDTVCIDAMTVTAPDGAWITVPESGSPVESASWAAIKALYR